MIPILKKLHYKLYNELKLILLILYLSISGCSFFAEHSPIAIQLVPIINKSYKIEETYNISTGSSIIHIESGYTSREYMIANFILLSNQRLPELPDVWTIKYSTPKGFIIGNPLYSSKGIHIVPKSNANGKWKVGFGWVKLKNQAIIKKEPWQKIATFEEIAERTINKPIIIAKFRAELVYSGISQSTIRVMYREYTDDSARPAFYQELTYNLSESKQITFKSLIIEILEATNSLITFKVIDDGNLTWIPRYDKLTYVR